MSLVVRSLEARSGYLESVSENSARVARVSLVYQSTGHGEVKVEKAVKFPIHFIQEPSLTAGRVLAGGDLVPGKFPNADAGVWRWERDDRGFYVGAYLYFVVDSNGQAYRMNHHVTFEGDSLKMFNQQLMQTADETSTPSSSQTTTSVVVTAAAGAVVQPPVGPQ